MSTRCPSCGTPLALGVLRCRDCGADAREPAEEPGVAAVLRLDGTAPDAMRAADAMDELATIAPETLAEWRRLDLPRKGRVAELLTEMVAFLRRGKR